MSMVVCLLLQNLQHHPTKTRKQKLIQEPKRQHRLLWTWLVMWTWKQRRA